MTKHKTTLLLHSRVKVWLSIAETVAPNNCDKKAGVVESEQLVTSSRQCSSTSFGQNPEVFSLPSNDYPRASGLFTWFGSEWFFPVPEDQRSADGSLFCRQRSHEEYFWGMLKHIPEKAYQECFNPWKVRMKCVMAGGEYIEGCKYNFPDFSIYMF